MPRKMLRWNVVLPFTLLCVQVFSEVQDSGAVISKNEGKNLGSSSITVKVGDNSTVKVPIVDDISNNVNGREHSNKTVHVKHKSTVINDTKNDQDAHANMTEHETRLRNNVESMNFGAVLRGFYVFLGLSVIVIMYFTVRAIRLGRKKTKVKKYGILANREDLEMTPLGADDDEEDTTVFDLSNHPGQ